MSGKDERKSDRAKGNFVNFVQGLSGRIYILCHSGDLFGLGIVACEVTLYKALQVEFQHPTNSSLSSCY